MKIFLIISSKIKSAKDGAKNFLIGQMKKPVNTKHPMKKFFGLFCNAKGHFGVINVTQHALNTVSNSMESKMYGINPGKIKKNKKGDSQLYAHTTIKRFVPAHFLVEHTQHPTMAKKRTFWQRKMKPFSQLREMSSFWGRIYKNWFSGDICNKNGDFLWLFMWVPPPIKRNHVPNIFFPILHKNENASLILITKSQFFQSQYSIIDIWDINLLLGHK